MNVLVIFAHPNVDNGSIGNKIILNEIKKLEQIEVRELYKMYPDYKINRETEQKALLDAELIIFQFPFYWYNVPSLLKEWEDIVLSYGFAFGSKGDKLKGKEFLVSTTIGGPAESYRSTGYNTFTVEEYITPLQQIAIHSGMTFLRPIYSHGVVNIPEHDYDTALTEQAAIEHADKLLGVINDKLAQ